MAKLDCIRCKGKHYTKPLSCGHSYCPIYSKIHTMYGKKLDKKEFRGTAPTVFVGRYNYPNLNVGIMAPPEKITKEAEIYDSPNLWSARNFRVEDVLKFRSVMINSRFQTHIKSKPRFLEMSQEVAMASKPVDMEFFLERKPRYQIKHSDVETVMGANARMKKTLLQENPKIDRKVDYIVSDSDLKSVDSLVMLSKKKYTETFLTRLLSIGNLGLKSQRKLVPTRWSITAVDDTLGKSLIKEIKQYKECDYMLSFGGYLGNYFLILFFPRVWSYELFETYMSSTLLNPDAVHKYTTDHELYQGRKSYAEECAGGYYASRLPILQKLKAMKRQASIIVIRYTTSEYSAPLGVWVVREAVRKSLASQIQFNSEEEMLQYGDQLLFTHFKTNIHSFLMKSKVYKHMKTQKSIKDFF